MRTHILALSALTLVLVPQICSAAGEYRDYCLDAQAESRSIMESVRRVVPPAEAVTPVAVDSAAKGQANETRKTEGHDVTPGPTASLADNTGA